MSASSPTGSDPELINHSTADVTAEPEESSAETPQRPPTLSRASTLYKEKCWICLSTRDEDPPSPPNPPTEWRSPCLCSLQAHESCLLDWVADQESPKTRTGRSQTMPDQILCPQCKSEIKIQRPRDPIVALTRRLDRIYSRATLPVLATSVVGTVLSGCWVYGRMVTHVIFGREHADLLYEWAKQEGPARRASYLLIPICLVFSRTSYEEYVVPLGQLTLVSTQIGIDGMLLGTTGPFWPPLPSTAFTAIPVIKAMYSWTWEKCLGAMNRRWLDEIMPRQDEDYENRGDNIPEVLNEAQMAEQEMQEGDVVFEVELNLGPGDDDMPQLEEAGQGADGEQANPQPRNANGNNVVAGRNINEYVTDTHSVMGSLLLPFAAKLGGYALELILPKTWTSTRWNYYPSSGRIGFFATQWGRNVAGGLAFCFLKDILLMYCRWRLADSHKRRKIMNYDKASKKYVSV